MRRIFVERNNKFYESKNVGRTPHPWSDQIGCWKSLRFQQQFQIWFDILKLESNEIWMFCQKSFFFNFYYLCFHFGRISVESVVKPLQKKKNGIHKKCEMNLFQAILIFSAFQRNIWRIFPKNFVWEISLNYVSIFIMSENAKKKKYY